MKMATCTVATTRICAHTVTFDVDTGDLNTAVQHLTTLGLRSLVSQPPTLEDLFMRHYTTAQDEEGDRAEASR